MATVRKPSSLAARRMRMEISPRLSASSFRICRDVLRITSRLRNASSAGGRSFNGGYHVWTPGARAYFFRDARGHLPARVGGEHFGFGNCRALPPFLIHGVPDKLHGHRVLPLNGEREPVDGLVGGLPENFQLVFSTGHIT